MRVLIAWLILSTAAGAEPPTINAVANVLNLDGPAAPFQVLAGDPFTSRKVVMPKNAIPVTAALDVEGDAPFQNLFGLRTIDGKAIKADAVGEWIAGLKVGETHTLGVSRCRRLPDKRYKVEPEQVKVTIRTVADEHRRTVVTSRDKVEQAAVSAMREPPWNFALVSSKKADGAPRLLLHLKHNGPKFLNTAEVKIGASTSNASIPVPQQGRTQTITDGGNALETIVVDVTDNPSFHMAIASNDGTSGATLRFEGTRGQGENTISATELTQAKSVLVVHYADLFGK